MTRPMIAFALGLLVLTADGRADFQGPRVETYSLPERGAKSAGYSVRVSCEDIRLFGDVHVTVHVAADGTGFLANQSIAVRLTTQSGTTQPPGNDCNYELPIDLPEGQARVTKHFYLPKWSVGGDFEITVAQDRRTIEGYRARIRGGALLPHQAQMLWWEAAGERFAWLTEDSADRPDARVFFTSMAPELLNVNDLATSQSGFEFANVWRQFRPVAIDALPEDWRGFDCADVWISEPRTLRSLITRNRRSAAALCDYIRCGGTLWIVGADAEAALAGLFDAPLTTSASATKLIEAAVKEAMGPYDYEPARAATYQNASSRNYMREYAMSQGGGINPLQAQTVDLRFGSNRVIVQRRELEGEKTPLDVSDFMIRDIAMGRVVACKSANAIPGSPQQWRALIGMTTSGASETLRRAVDPCFGDRRFWDWIIPDVAQPPVYTFIGLLIVFVIVVGPLAYRKFTKMGRGYLMLFVAPLLALVTTLIMFAYGLVADGLSTRERVREITWIGDRSGTAARVSRMTYFAGIRPSEGMAFPGNAIVLPYQLPSVSNWYEAGEYEISNIGTIRLDDQTMWMDSGFLPSRQQKQYVTYRPVERVGLVEMDAGDAATAPTLKSGLEFEIRQGVVCDRAGNYYRFDKLAAGATVSPTPVTKRVASELLSALYAIQRPIAPPAVASSRRAGESTIDMISQLGNQPRRRQPLAGQITAGESAVEDWLRTQMQIASELPPGTYVSVADVTADCISVASAELVESVHYVIGVLP